VASQNDGYQRQVRAMPYRGVGELPAPYKHKLPEGAMSCVDCHNPHGTHLPTRVRGFEYGSC
jgi:hypothetical protein